MRHCSYQERVVYSLAYSIQNQWVRAMFHLLIPASINDSYRAKRRPRRRSNGMTNHPLTYGRLREAMGEKMQAEHKPPQSLDNLNGAMKAFQDFFGMRDIDV